VGGEVVACKVKGNCVLSMVNVADPGTPGVVNGKFATAATPSTENLMVVRLTSRFTVVTERSSMRFGVPKKTR
jgi:hypothetical protein